MKHLKQVDSQRQKVDQWLQGAGGSGECGSTANGHRAALGGDETLKLDSGDEKKEETSEYTQRKVPALY